MAEDSKDILTDRRDLATKMEHVEIEALNRVCGLLDGVDIPSRFLAAELKALENEEERRDLIKRKREKALTEFNLPALLSTAGAGTGVEVKPPKAIILKDIGYLAEEAQRPWRDEIKRSEGKGGSVVRITDSLRRTARVRSIVEEALLKRQSLQEVGIGS